MYCFWNVKAKRVIHNLNHKFLTHSILFLYICLILHLTCIVFHLITIQPYFQYIILLLCKLSWFFSFLFIYLLKLPSRYALILHLKCSIVFKLITFQPYFQLIKFISFPLYWFFVFFFIDWLKRTSLRPSLSIRFNGHH